MISRMCDNCLRGELQPLPLRGAREVGRGQNRRAVLVLGVPGFRCSNPHCRAVEVPRGEQRRARFAAWGQPDGGIVALSDMRVGAVRD